GADVEGIDPDAAMVARAQAEHPQVRFRQADARDLQVPAPVDAVFSNAVLHWIPEADQQRVLDTVHRVLRPGGRFVAQMGGAGNMAQLLAAMTRARASVGLPPVASPWYFPTPQQQTNRLEQAGFAAIQTWHFPRPSTLADGAAASDWVGMFGPGLTADVPPNL